ncbi:MAG: hypothetical protein R2697_18790 [Ilumatobacteraceae bacterium]
MPASSPSCRRCCSSASGSCSSSTVPTGRGSRPVLQPDDFRTSWPLVVDGFWLNIELFIYSMLTIPIVALIVAVMRSLRGPAFFPIRLLAVIFTDVFRGIP